MSIKVNNNQLFAFVSFLMLFIIACDMIMPAAFWTGYQSDLIVENISDQGPWGGRRVIHWESNEPQTFLESEVLVFAEESDWVITDTIMMTASQLRSEWVTADGLVEFRLFYEARNWGNRDFNRRIVTDAIIFKFETGWVREDPGTNAISPAFGYVMMNADGTRLSVYHLWGNS